MMQRPVLLLAAAVVLGCLALPASSSEHLPHIAQLVSAWGDRVITTADAPQQLTNYDPQTGLVRDAGGRLNIAECSLNYAAALFELGANPERAARVLEAVLANQDRAEDSPTRGLFRWLAGTGSPYDANATLYLAPALAHLSAELGGSGRAGDLLRDSVSLALTGLLAHPKRVEDGFGAAMWAGAVCALGAASGNPIGQEAGRQMVFRWLKSVVESGIADGNSPTYDALRIGGLRWAWQAAADEQARAEAGLALELCYRDLLQRYDPVGGVVGGAMLTAYPADYAGSTGVPAYLLGADLPAAMAGLREVEPLAMYFALSEYAPGPDLLALADARTEPYELRTRVPGEDPTVLEAASTCTWMASGHSLGTMSGPVGRWSIPIMMTSDLPERGTSYWYLPDVAGHVQSAQTGGLAICSFTFDGIGLAGRTQARVRGVLGSAPEVDRVLIGSSEWIGEPSAVGENATVALQRGGCFLCVKVLQCGYGETGTSETKPGILTWVGEGDDRAAVLDLYGRQADYELREPLDNVRVSVLIEVASAADWPDLESFARAVKARRVTELVRTEKRRARELEDTNPLKLNEPRTRAEMVFITSAIHSLELSDENLKLGLVENMSDRTLISRTLPTELPPGYLWLSPGLTLDAGGDLPAALGR